jgi:arylsulfatase A
LRGTKYQVNEGGIRVPLFVRWSKHFAPGERDQMVSFVDLLPTILDLCQVELPTKNQVDGESFARILDDASASLSTTRFWQWNRAHPNYTHNAAVRRGQFKLVRPFVTRSAKLKDSTEPEVLYDLQADPTESHDVTDQYPDVARQLSRELKRWCDSVERDRVRPEAMPADTK